MDYVSKQGDTAAGEVKSDAPGGTDGAPAQARSRRGDFLVGGLGMFMQMGTGLIMLPATAVFLSPSDLAFWSVFLTIQTLNSMLEFGFTPTFARNFTYVLAGARKLSREGVPDRTAGDCDRGVLRNLLAAAEGFYARLGVVSFLLLATAGSFYLFNLHKHLPEATFVWEAWAILLLAHPISTFFNWQNAVVIGADRMRQFYFVIIASRLTQVVISVVGLMIWPNLLVLAFAYGVSMIVFRLMTGYFIRDVVKSVAHENPDRAAARDMVGVIAHSATKVGYVTLGAFLANRFNLLSITLFLSATSAAQFAIAQQALNALTSVSLVGISMLMPAMANARIHGDKKQLKELLAFTNVSAAVLFICGMITLLVLGNWLLSSIHSKTLLPSVGILLLMAVVFWLDSQIFIATQYIMTGNRVPHLRAVVATGLFISLGVFVAGYFGGDLVAMLWVQAGLLVAYNAWKWPKEACDEVGLTLAGHLPNAMNGARNLLMRRAPHVSGEH
jgi:O-antigen/teichoic acid export membrane protein